MWFERFVIIATTLHRDFIPSSWSYYTPSWVEVAIYIFTFGLFGTLYLIFMRVAPVVAMAEIKAILKSSGNQYVGPAVAQKTGLNVMGYHGHAEEHGHNDHAPAVNTIVETATDTATEVITETDVDTLEDFKEDFNYEDDSEVDPSDDDNKDNE